MTSDRKALTRLPRSQTVLVAAYLLLTAAGSALAFSSPTDVVRQECSPVVEQPDLDFCLEVHQYSHPAFQVASFTLALTFGAVAGGLAWWRWKRVVFATEPRDVVDTATVRGERLRRRSPLLAIAFLPLAAGLAVGGSTTSSWVKGERTCETQPFGAGAREGPPPTFIACKQIPIEVERIVLRASPWSWPLRLTGLGLMAGALVWWLRAWRLERPLRRWEYSYVDDQADRRSRSNGPSNLASDD